MSTPDSRPDTFSRFQLPGLSLPLNWTPHEPNRYYLFERNVHDAQGEGENLFPTALNDEDRSLPMTTLRELTILSIQNMVTDKPDWDLKVFDDEIAKKWKAEALATPGRDVSQKMVDWALEELRYKAKIFQQTLAVSVLDGDVVKSDIAVPEYITESLKASVQSLEDVTDKYKDYHPGSDRKVLDLVHPSLFPLVYGKSRVLEDSLIELDDCIESCGKGLVLPIRPDDECALDYKGREYGLDEADPYSKNFQWLPSEVEFTNDGRVKFTSYINNLHPQKCQDLYDIIEQVIDRAIPLWNMTLTPLKDTSLRSNRIPYDSVEYMIRHPDYIPADEGPQQQNNESDDDFHNRREAYVRSVARVLQPEPGEFRPREVPDHMTVDLERDYGHRGLQIIVKLANIELTPVNPEYEGGTWHVEGQMNEHICATALYYYDSKNISESRLAFRQQCSLDPMYMGYPQDRHEFLTEVYGCDPRGPAVQEIGSVICKEGRLLTFPNVLQHQVLPFKLADATQPGHRKILALFLVDPGIRIISTANVPPQQRDWWSESVIKDFAKSGKALGKLSPELQNMIFENVDEFPLSMEEAKEIRLKLMEERNYVVQNVVALIERPHEFSLCEH